MRLSFFFSVFCSFFLHLSPSAAQLPNGAIAPDFTLTDIDGQSHNLYQLLDEGKHVIIDFFATWCGPCWNYHQKRELQKIWDTYGPNGTNEVYVFFIEGDPFTNLNALNGIGSNTLGNYTAGTTYPIFNESSIVSAYHVSYWPTVYWICPNKRTKEVGQVSFNSVELFLDGACSMPTDINNAEILGFTSDIQPFCDHVNYTPEIRIQNAGTNPVTSGRFSLGLNGQHQQTFLWEGYLLPFQTQKIIFNSLQLYTQSTITVVIDSINHSTDNHMLNNSATITKRNPIARSNEVIVEVQTDEYGYEIYWELRDENGYAFASGGNDLVVPGDPQSPHDLQLNPNGFYHNDTLYTHTITLPASGCYEFYIIDDYGDGLCCHYGNGFYRLKDTNGNLLLEGAQGFHISREHFEAQGSSTAISATLADNFPVVLFPNPASETIWLRWDAGILPISHVEFFDILGKKSGNAILLPVSSGEQQFPVEVNHLNPGIYLLRLYYGDRFFNKKIVIE